MLVSITRLGHFLVLAALLATLGISDLLAADFVFYHGQSKKILPRIYLENRIYLPLIELLQILDLPYSESVSTGTVKITVGKNSIKLTKDRAIARVNEVSLGLQAPVVVANNRWLVSSDFVNGVLNRVLAEKIVIGNSGNRFLVGAANFNRLNVKAVAASQQSTIVIQMNVPTEVEVKKEESRIILSFGNAPMDPAKDDFQYKDELVNSITFEETPNVSQLVVQLSDRSLQTKVTHLPSQSAYLLEVTRLMEGNPLGPERLSLQPRVIRTSQDRRRWRHITIDAGHGGIDRGVVIKENLFEKDVALEIARKVRWLLQAKLGVETVLTRVSDQNLSLEDRAMAANAAQSDLFLSIHIGNWSPSGESGNTVYVIKGNPNGGTAIERESREQDRVTPIRFIPWEQAQLNSLDWSVRLAEILQTELNRTDHPGNSPRVFRHAPLKLLSSLAMPAVLLELGNANHPEFKETVNISQFQNLVAMTILAALERFRPLHERP